MERAMDGKETKGERNERRAREKEGEGNGI